MKRKQSYITMTQNILDLRWIDKKQDNLGIGKYNQ